MKTFVSIVTVAALAAAALAQDQSKQPMRVEHDVVKYAPGKGGDVMFERQAVRVGGANTVEFVSAEASILGKTVKGAPYSAEAVTESTQTLADGNRIVSKSSAFTYRDSEGRTRREMTLSMPGMTDPPTFITINDPVAGVSYHLDTKMKIARKLPMAPDGAAFGVVVSDAAMPTRVTRTGVAGFPGQPVPAMGATISMEHASGPQVTAVRMRPGGEPKTESLGKQAMEGVEAEGSRSTITIPAGEVGNEREISIVTERWYSPELQTVVLSKHSDARMGETIYSLKNIKRAVPHASLFEIPSDYTVANDEGPGVRLFRKIEPK